MTDALTLLTNLDDRSGDGPAMKLLNDQQRKFVVLHVVGGLKGNAAARKAGYSDANVAQWRLLRRPDVIEAIREETAKLLGSSAVLGARVLIEIASDEEHKDRLKAGRELLAHAGLAPVMEQKITVERTDLTAEAVRAEIRRLMARIGPEAPRLLESAGIVDAEFSEVERQPAEPDAGFAPATSRSGERSAV